MVFTAKIYVFSLLLASIIKIQGQSQFWIKAQETLDLSKLRVQNPRKPPMVVNDAMSNFYASNFLPLCGNGRIDTKEDYAAYYDRERGNILTVYREWILTGYSQLSQPKAFHTLAIYANEECDDGNRIDFDGCSADCMYMDLWTSSCEIATDKTLEYEDIIYDTVRKAMVVSATTGIYMLDADAKESMLVSLQLIAPKSMQVTDIFRFKESLILYSAAQQEFWQLVDGKNSIELLKSVAHLLGKWNSSQVDRNSHQNSDGSIILYDNTKMLYLTSPIAEPYVCPLNTSVERCIFLANIDGGSKFVCDGLVDVSISQQSCNILTGRSTGTEGSIWSDAFTKLTWLTATISIVDKEYFNISPEIPFDEGQVVQPYSLEVYHPMGGFVAFTMNSARRIGVNSITPPLFYFTGNMVLKDMVEDGKASCGPDICIFDNDREYDIFDRNPLKYAAKINWNDILQNEIYTEASLNPPLLNLYAIKQDNQRYTRLLNSFVMKFWTFTRRIAVLGMQRHPVTKNIWAVRKDRIIEVSKSGVHLTLADGKCLPAGIALCNPCQWAPKAGMACRSCFDKDLNSLAWNIKCKRCTSGRRLLNSDENSIKFVLSGIFSNVSMIWPTAVNDTNTGFINITIVTNDIVQTMKSIQLKLLNMTDVQVITKPYVSLPMDQSILPPQSKTTIIKINDSKDISPTNTTDSEEEGGIDKITFWSILGGGLALVIVLILVIAFLLTQQQKHQNSKRHSIHNGDKGQGVFNKKSPIVYHSI